MPATTSDCGFDYRSHDGTRARSVRPNRIGSSTPAGAGTWSPGTSTATTGGPSGSTGSTRASPTGPRFTPREAPDLASTTRGVTWGAYRYQARFTLHAPAAVIADRIAPTVGSIEAIDDTSCTFTTGANTFDELLLYVGLLGIDFRIESPQELIDHVSVLTARLTAAAG